MKLWYKGSANDCPRCGSSETFTDADEFPYGIELADDGVEVTRHMYCGECGKAYTIHYAPYEARWQGR